MVTFPQKSAGVPWSGVTRGPHRPLLFALALLIHAGLLYLLASHRYSADSSDSLSSDAVESLDRLRTVLVFLEDTAESKNSPVAAASLASQLPQEVAPPQIAAPRPLQPLEQITSPASRDDNPAAPGIDWWQEAEKVARARALEAPPDNARERASGTPKPKPEFGWSHSRIHRVEPIEGGGILVWINERCAVAIGIMIMPACKIGAIPARGDLFDYLHAAPEFGDWKED